MAKVVPEDPYTGLADTEAAPPDTQDLDMVDAAEPSAEELIARAAIAEEAVLAVRQGITNTEGADAGYSRRREIFLVTSAGFAGHRVGTSHSVSATALAGVGTGMQRDYDYDLKVYLADLDDPAAIGLSAWPIVRWRGSIRSGRKPAKCPWSTIPACRPHCWAI